MRRYLTCCAPLVLLLTGCVKHEPVYIVPHVQEDLRRPCIGPKMSGHTTEGQLSTAIIHQSAALQCANGKIVTIDKILDDAEEHAWQSRPPNSGN